MAHYFRLESNIEIAPGTKVIKADQVDGVISAEDIIAEAYKKRDQILAEANATYEAEKERGYQEGLERAKAEKVEAINKTLKKGADFTHRLEGSISEIIQTILTKLLGQFDEKELVLRLIKNVIKDYTRSQKIRVLVTPDHVRYLNQHLSEVIKDHSVIEFIEVVPDYSVAPGSCIIDAKTEMIFISIEDQLSAIGDMMKGVVKGGII